MVDRDSGKRRVRKRVEDWRYILEICEEACREDVEFREDMEEVRSCEEVSVSRVGARVVAMLLVEVIVVDEIPETRIERKEKGTGKGKGDGVEC